MNALRETPLATLLRSQGATIAVRHGHRVAADFGSVVSETAVCLYSVGLTDRFGRSTLAVRGVSNEVDAALARLHLADAAARAVRLDPQRAVARCEAEATDPCRLAIAIGDVQVADVTADQCALGLVGPNADEALELAQLEAVPFATTVVPDAGGVEILVPRLHAATAWMRLLSCGRSLGIACVGFDALERLAVAHAGSRRAPVAVARRTSVRPPDGQTL